MTPSVASDPSRRSPLPPVRRDALRLRLPGAGGRNVSSLHPIEEPTMPCLRRVSVPGRAIATALALAVALSAGAADIGQVKVAKGRVDIERAGTTVPAGVGARLQEADVVRTGPDGSVGITM